MLVWPFPPNKSTETWSFLTDVQETYSRENRRSLRKGAFLSMSLSSTLSETELGLADGLYRAALASREDVFVPLWGQAQAAPGVLSVGSPALPVDASLGDWFLGYALIWSSPLVWELVEVSSPDDFLPGAVRPATVQLASTTVSEAVSPLIIPVSPGYFSKGLSISRQGFNNVSVGAEFRGLGDIFVNETTWPTVGSFLVNPERELQAGGQMTLVRPETFVDNGTGPVVRVPTKDHFANTRPFSLRSTTLSQRQATRNNLLYLEGRMKEFVRISTVVGEVSIPGVNLSVGDTIPLTYAGPRLALVGRLLYLKTTGGEFLREIVSADATTVTLDENLPATTPSERLRVALADRTRLDTDELELQDTPGNGAVFSLTLKDL